MFSLIKTPLLVSCWLLLLVPTFSTAAKPEKLDKSLNNIMNFHFVSKGIASSGLIALDDYSLIKQYGFKHVINLIPGDQTEERDRVQSLGLSYQQIEVDWHEPSLEDFENFASLMKSYGKDKIYVHCQANYRASTFIYLYRLIQLRADDDVAKKDLLEVWTPTESWDAFIDKVKFDQM